jgi:hypothetical protein
MHATLNLKAKATHQSPVFNETQAKDLEGPGSGVYELALHSFPLAKGKL